MLRSGKTGRCLVEVLDELDALQGWPATDREEGRGLTGFLRILCELAHRIGVISPVPNPITDRTVGLVVSCWPAGTFRITHEFRVG